MRVAVVGAGWAGCATAVELAARGARVTVFEASRVPGGRARRVLLDGRALDNGQHLLIGAYRETLALMRRVGVDPDTALLRLPLTLEVPGEFALRAPRLPAPAHSALALLGARGLSWTDKIAAARLLLALRRARFACPPDETVTALLERHAQTERLRRLLWVPLCLAALNTAPDLASAQVFAAVLRDSLAAHRAASDLLIPRTDLSALLPEAALAHVAAHGGILRLGLRVRALAPAARGWRLDPGGEDFDAVVLACAPWHASALLAPLPATAELAATLAALPSEPIVTVYLDYGTGVRLPRPLLALDGGHAQWLFDRGQLGGPTGLLAAVISAGGPHMALPHHTLAQAVDAELRRYLPLPPLVHQRVIAEKRATFACHPRLPRPPSETALPGLLLAGDYVAGEYPATLEGAVRSGLGAARRLAAW